MENIKTALLEKASNCPDCAVPIGSLHKEGCDIECCPRCGYQQMFVCDCIYEVNGINPATLEEEHPDIFRDGATDEMMKVWNDLWGSRRIPWSGDPPAILECRRLGWYAKFIPDNGWETCNKDDPGAIEDLNRLFREARWNPETQKWEVI